MTTTAPTDAPPLVVGQTYEQMTVGTTFRTPARTITETDLVLFRQLVGVTEPLFMDSEHAASAGYTGRLCPGMMVFSYAEGLVIGTNVLHGTGMAFMRTDLSISAPVYVGDTLTVVVEVTESRPASRGNRGVVTTRNTVLNQRGETVMTYTPVRLIKGDDAG
ncbi:MULTISPECIES: MaoC family dehydratase [Pseudofrankia]|uniref:MaoC family dehydratase n=1 Tax=Pseudofrankia TaxID=2994363 RepID=UPI000234B3B8|nr:MULTISPECIES: MaoC family dehydratase N-terminal domain-containing protein [Pseudofrankia]OHV29861.1 acyl dehydratase [Pseudofrankia sp. EUN1h]